MNKTIVDDCTLLNLPKISDNRGNLTFIEKGICPFEIKRIYYLYDIPAESIRGGHAHKSLNQIIIPLSGSFNIELDDGDNKKNIHLYRPYQGLFLCQMIWREINYFSSGAVCLVLASDIYNENDYYRSYPEFIESKYKLESC